MMTNEKGYNIKSIIIGIAFLVTFSTTFLHLFSEKRNVWKPYNEHYKLYDKILIESKQQQQNLLEDLRKDKINIDSFLKSFEKIDLKKSEDLKRYYEKKELLKKEFSFMGFSSFRYFLYTLGFALFPLIIASLLLVMVLRFQNQIQYKRIYMYGCIGFIYISAFWLCHTLFATVDLPTWSYNISFALLTILVTAIIYWFTNLYNTISAKKRAEEKEWHEFITNSYELLDLLKDPSDLIKNGTEDDD